MVTVEDGWEVRLHRARKTWRCPGQDRLHCQGEIAPGDRYAEVRRAGLAQSSFGKRYCLSCAEAEPAPPRERKLVLTAERTTLAPEHPAERVDGVARDARRGSSEVADRRPHASLQHVGEIARLVSLWVAVFVLTVGALYATMRGLDWFVQVMQQPIGPGTDGQ